MNFYCFIAFTIVFVTKSDLVSYKVVSYSWDVTVVKYSFIFFHPVIQDFISRLWLGWYCAMEFT